MPEAVRPPVGTIALLFTDVEGSTRLATTLGEQWKQVLAEHRAIVGGAISAEGGYVDGTEGDSFFATFIDARAAARAAVVALRELRSHPWPANVGELKVRMGLHVGYVERTDADGYVGLEVHRAARVSAAAHGGQLIMTGIARELVGDVIVTEPLGSHRLKDFPGAVALFCAVVDGRGATSFPPPRTQVVRPTNLPAGSPALIGREEDIARVRAALIEDRERLVTLTGRGGAGKTSLALQIAATLLDDYAGGVWLSRLANLDKPEAVMPAIASSVGARDVEGSPSEAVITRLRERGPTLLVLDNFEHLLAAVPQIGDLLDALGDLQILVTSQSPTRLSAEFCVQLDALGDDDAVVLLERVGRRRRPGFSAAGAEREAVLEIVALLDGLPLALELAAARLALLTPAQLRDRLRASHEVLKDDRADRADRHRSLEATLEWTLGLLDQRARELFVRLGAFAGPVELEEIEAVAGQDGLDVLGELAKLLDVALVRRVEAGDGRIRFGLPEALRQIAAGRLEATPQGSHWRRAHAVRQYQLVWDARAIFKPARVWDKAIDAGPEIDAALRWTREVGDPLAAPIAAARATMLSDLGRLREALAIVDPVLADPPDDPIVHAQALWAYAWVMTVCARTDEALAAAQQAIELTDDPETKSQTVSVRGLAHTFAGNWAEGVRDASEATAIARSVDDAMVTGALLIEAQARQFAGEFDRALELITEAERVGGPVDSAFLWRRHTVLGDLATLTGKPHDALAHYADSLEGAEQRHNDAQVMFDLLGVANALAMVGSDEDALEVTGMALQLVAELGGPEAAAATHLLGRDEVTAARERLGASAASACIARGRTVGAGQRVTRACVLARAEIAIGARPEH